MELRVLNYFLAAAREENITKAAQLLHVTQPTLSRQIIQLEKELDVKLFVRSNHNIILTDDGMLLKRRAEEIVALAEKTKGEFSRRDEHLTGEITIGSGELLSMRLLSEILSSFQKKYPLIRYELYSGDADNVKAHIESGLLDAGLLLKPVDIGKYEFIRMPLKEEWGILTHKDSYLAAKEHISPEDLVGVPLLIAKRGLVQNTLANWFGSHFERLEIVATYNLLYNAAIMAQNKMGVALCLKLSSTYDELCYVPLSPELKMGSVFVWKKNQIFPPATAAFLEHIKAYAKGISRDLI
ncbi:MAG: LysR family transcriptional regulator [Syntrophomonadaceae bacterium]|jgi:DNA-binding transcriptional LysR family regulator|nr:LysR family transcriptional regulator [Syntrophomonadaceae bacterium]